MPLLQEKTSHHWVLLDEGRLSVSDALDFLQVPAAGGVDVFLGITRRWTGDRETERLEYEAYAEMALREMMRLAARAAQQWPVLRTCVFHRLGVVPLTEASVLIGVAAAHRAEAFAACRYLIDALKQEVPIWKREYYTDGRSEWVEPRSPSSES